MSWPLLAWSGPLLSFDSAGQGVGALLENRSARLAEIGLPLPQAAFNPRGIRNVAAANPEGVRRTRGPLLGRSPILLREGDRLTKRSRRYDNKSHFVFRNQLASLLKLMFSLDSANRIPAERREPFRKLPCGKSSRGSVRAPHSAAISPSPCVPESTASNCLTLFKRRWPSALSLPAAVAVVRSKSEKARRDSASSGNSCGSASIAARSPTARIADCARKAALNSAGDICGYRRSSLRRASKVFLSMPCCALPI